jgi:D-arabinose 1-dehydrogenase-like Zn-dependent alcohol dehydrogenase
VVGGGPVGFLAAELAKARGWEVSLVQRSAARRESLEALGYAVAESLADVVVRPTAVIDAAGAYGPSVPLTLAPVARKELRVVGVRSGSRADLIGVLAAAASDTIRLPQVTVWPLLEINAAFAALREKTVAGKAVIVPPARAT